MDPVVIIGSGLAGYALARELRKLDVVTPLVILSRDEASFYSKPMLSNALASGKSAAQIASASAEQMAAQLGTRIMAGTEVEAIDTARCTLHAGEVAIRYSKLVLALGADPIALPLAGDAANEVMRVNDLAAYARFRAAIEGKQRVVLLGAGLIGCEFANDLAAAGYRVRVIDPAPRPLGKLLPEAAAERVQLGLAAMGVVWHLGTTARSVSRAVSGLRVDLADGTALEADAVLSAIGLRPRTQLAQHAGLKIHRGIVTDRRLQTSAADAYALGDCAEVDGQTLPYVLPIMQAARALAKTLTGTATPVVYPAMPVVVKTPAMPVVVCPPPALSGSWKLQQDASGIEARFEDESGKLLGFALVGAATARKQALTRLTPPVLV
ncbi:MAG: pyridine nucleotide-disulfide oxidoreductase [Betaproteobacteria bacterium RIFCSPLOWO2_12_FULL_64_23]|nr:MAG: pyridine nucleotide-disulfide oxidoreductase [Betaproteobacteria bacterium RIFCSPLOWO2_12_FULL_64_23]